MRSAIAEVVARRAFQPELVDLLQVVLDRVCQIANHFLYSNLEFRMAKNFTRKQVLAGSLPLVAAAPLAKLAWPSTAQAASTPRCTSGTTSGAWVTPR